MPQSEETKIAVLETQMATMIKSVDSLAFKIDTLTDKIDNHYVKKEEFNPIKDQVDDLRLWKAKVLGIALATSVLVEVIIRYFLK